MKKLLFFRDIDQVHIDNCPGWGNKSVSYKVKTAQGAAKYHWNTCEGKTTTTNQWGSARSLVDLGSVQSSIPNSSCIYLFCFYSLRWRFVLHTEISGIYNSPSYFALFIYFSYHSYCCKDQLTVLILKLSSLEPDQLRFRAVENPGNEVGT